MDCQELMKILPVEKLGQGGTTPIIGNQGLGRIQICSGGMVNHTPLGITKIIKLSLKLLLFLLVNV